LLKKILFDNLADIRLDRKFKCSELDEGLKKLISLLFVRNEK